MSMIKVQLISLLGLLLILSSYLGFAVTTPTAAATPVPTPTMTVREKALQAVKLGEGKIISGTITGEIGGDSPRDILYVFGDLEVPAGQVLTITGDTILVFEAGHAMTISGKLIGDGHYVKPIRFSSNDEAGWGGLRFNASAAGSYCNYCRIENIAPNGVALQTEAPLSWRYSHLQWVPDGIAISTTVPLSLTNLWIDYVGTAIQMSGPLTQSQYLSHLTVTRCQKGIVNRGQTVHLDNSILTVCGLAVSTELSGSTTISYSLLHDNFENFATNTGGQLIQGSGILTVTPGFYDFPTEVGLRSDSPAVNAADPQADYSQEPGYNGGRADLGYYGNTRAAPERPPVDQMEVTMTAIGPTAQAAMPGQKITYHLQVTNSGQITDQYTVSISKGYYEFKTSLTAIDSDETVEHLPSLVPQNHLPITVWVRIPQQIPVLSDVITVNVRGDYHGRHYGGQEYDISDQVQLTTTVVMFQEEQGQLVVEAEHFAKKIERGITRWEIQTTLNGYADSGYMGLNEDVDYLFTPDQSPSRLHYPLNFNHTGVYTVWLRGYAPNAAGDSLYVSLDTKPVSSPLASQTVVTMTGFAPQTWSWSNQTTSGQVATLTVTEPGLHTLHLWQREDGLRLDRVILTSDPTFTPTGAGPPESPQGR